jgi:ubiquinone/menaquinone biosynthesis C-methylase UbiE
VSSSVYLVSAVVGLVIIVGMVWRLLSRRQTLPCPTWLGWMVELDNPFTRTNRASVIIEHLDVQPGMQVLDAGCGPGRLTIPLAKKVTDKGGVTALDIQEGMLQRVTHKAQTEHLHNIEFIQAGLGEGTLDENRYDRSVLVTVLGEIPNQQAAMKDLYAALKPSGVLSITEVIFDPHFQSSSKVRALARAVGFRERALYGHKLAYTLNFVKPDP